MRDSLLEGFDDAFFCLLLVLLPNLQKFNFWNPQSQVVSAMVWRIVVVAMKIQNLGKLGSALSRLTTVELHHEHPEFRVDPDFAIPFAACHRYAHSAITRFVAMPLLQILQALPHRPRLIKTMLRPVSIPQLARSARSSVSTMALVSNLITRRVLCGLENLGCRMLRPCVSTTAT